MTLPELYEELFLEICDLNRIGRNGGVRDYESVRADILSKLQGIRNRLQDAFRKAQADSDRQSETHLAHLEAQVEKLELPILFFIDSMIAESKLSFARQWHLHRLAFEKNQRAGDQKFFELLEETLNDPKEEARERLVIYYTCLGLGFTGAFAGKPQQIKTLLSRMTDKIADLKEFDPHAPVCAAAYQHVDKRNLIEPPGRKMIMLALVFACFTLAAALSYIWMFKTASEELSDSIEVITKTRQ